MTTHMIDEEHEHGSLLGFWQKFFFKYALTEVLFCFLSKTFILTRKFGDVRPLGAWKVYVVKLVAF